MATNPRLLFSNLRLMKIKIERGIISLNDNEEVIVYSPGSIHPINPVSLDTSVYRNGEKVIGVIIDKKFTPLQQLEQIENTVAFGYVLDFDPDTRYISIQLIKDFSVIGFDPFNAYYYLDRVISTHKNKIKPYNQ